MDREGPHTPGKAPASPNHEQAFPTTASERLQLALDAGAIIGTWVWDIPENRVTADERFSRSFGLPADRCMAGIPIEEAFSSIHPDDRDRVSADIQEAMNRGGAYRCEYRVRQQDGSYRWIEANGRAELNSEGQAVRFPGILMDIESRRSAEAERDRMSALLRTFTAAVPGVVYAKDLEGRLIVANDGATQLIGKPPEFYLGKTDLEILEDKSQARQIMETDQRVMHGGKAVQIEERVDMPDGTATYWLSIKAPLCNEAGEVMGLIGSSIDVTARRNAESELLELNRTLEARIEEAVGTEKLEHHLEALRSYYRGRRDAFQMALQTHFADLADWQTPEGGLFFWLTLKHPIDTRTLLESALAVNVAFMPGEPFFPEPEKHLGHLRLNFSHVAPDKLDEGLKLLADVLRQALIQQAA